MSEKKHETKPIRFFFDNHLSGEQQSTKEDHEITEELYIRHLFSGPVRHFLGGMIEAGRLMQILLKDSMIIGKGWVSFFERDWKDDR